MGTLALQYSDPSKSNMADIEKVQKQATKCIVATGLSYKERLLKLNLLPLCFYIEMHDILTLFVFLINLYDVEITQFIRLNLE